jgi:hypothetical protein
VKDAVWRKVSLKVRCLDSGNSYSIFINIPLRDNDEFIWSWCFTGIYYVTDKDTRNVAQQYSTD